MLRLVPESVSSNGGLASIAVIGMVISVQASASELLLHDIVAHAPAAYVELALKEKSAEELNSYRWGPEYGLVFAAISNPDKRSVLQLLVESGVDVNQQDGGGMTGLHHAVGFDDLSFALKLIVLGARLDIENRAGRTALDVCEYAEEVGRLNETCDLVALISARQY